jgi:hypothetical protein
MTAQGARPPATPPANAPTGIRTLPICKPRILTAAKSQPYAAPPSAITVTACHKSVRFDLGGYQRTGPVRHQRTQYECDRSRHERGKQRSPQHQHRRFVREIADGQAHASRQNGARARNRGTPAKAITPPPINPHHFGSYRHCWVSLTRRRDTRTGNSSSG